MKCKLSLRIGWVWRVFILGLLFVFAGVPGGSGQASRARLAAQTGIAPGWLALYPDAPLTFENLSQHSLRLSPISPNYPQVAYGGDHLYYSYQDASGWHTQTVDSAWNVGSGAALALDSNGKAHISYYDATNGDMKYATNRWGSWFIDTVATTGTVGKYSDIAIDAWGDPAIVYFNSTASELHYIYYDSEYGDWGPDTVVAASVNEVNHPGWFSLALDTSVTPNRPHVSYYDIQSNSKGYIEWAHYNASLTWVHEDIDSCVAESTVCRLGEYNSIAVDPVTHQPAVAISFFDELFTATLLYKAYNGSSWVDDWYVPAMDTPTYISLAIDASSHPYISWSENGLKYAYRVSQDNWNTAVTLDASTTAGQPSSLAVVGSLAKVASYDSTSGIYEYIGHTRDTWLAPVILATQGHNVGNCTSLAVDGLGRSHISYFDNTSKSILYTRYNSDGTWFKNTIDSAGTANCFSAIAVNPLTNDPSAAFIRGGSLWYSLGTTWYSPSQIDTGISEATFSYQNIALAIESDGTPHLAYRKGTDLWYAYWTGAAWSRTSLATGSVGMHIALALGPDDQPRIAYYQSGALKYIRYSGGWQAAETIATNGSSGAGTGVALALDQSGQPMAAFMNNVGLDLRVSTRLCLPICGWTSPLLVDDDAEEQFSLALYRNGTPHLAAFSWTASEGFQLDYITRRGGVWSAQVLDSNNGVGMYPSIGLTPSGMPRVSYYNSENHDLKFALKLDSVLLPLIIR